MITSLSIAIISASLLLYVCIFPKKWEVIVDKENDFWVKRGIITEDASQGHRRFEKGVWMKVMLTIGLLGSIISLFAKEIVGLFYR